MADSLGNRLFSEQAQSVVVAALSETVDPALVPQPALAVALLEGDLDEQLKHLPGLGGLTDSPAETMLATGAAALRSAWLHGLAMIRNTSPRLTASTATLKSLAAVSRIRTPSGFVSRAVLSSSTPLIAAIM